MDREDHLKDDLGRPIPLHPAPERIVSLVPSVTECLFDLGRGDRLVGRTDFCISPADRVAAVPTVGGPKSVDVKLVTELRPDLVFANAEENDRGQVEALISLGCRVHVAFPRTIDQAARFLEELGRLVRAAARTSAMADELRGAAASPPEPPVPTACLIWKDPYLTAAADTLTSALIEAGGGRNVVADLPGRYPAVSLGDLAAAGPRVILLPSEPYEFGEADAREIEARVPGARALRVQGEWVTWYGSRMVQAIRGLRRLLDRHRA